MNQDVNLFIREYSKELTENNAAIFAGAGLSIPAGYSDWRTLLLPILEELGLDPNREDDLVAVAQHHINLSGGNRGRINQLLVNEFSEQAEITENHEILARLPISTYWTTNYDRTIERSLDNANKVADVKYTVEQLATTKPRRDAVVYKMHGDVDHADKAILTRDDYESYHMQMAPFVATLAGDLVSKTFLFLGFSFTDPNIEYILSRVRVSFSKNQRRHFCLMKEVERKHDETLEDFTYRQLKQTLFAKDLNRFNIKTLFVASYSEITEVLRKIEHKHKQKTIFISGSAQEYGSWSRDAALKFIHDLSQEIVMNDYKIVSGFGVGVGSAVINGSLEKIYSNRRKYSNEQLLLRPFPQQQSGTLTIAETWESYRIDMISYAGTAIFLFGNKADASGVVVSANGVRREFELAVAAGLRVLPVGSTGYVAMELWNEVLADLDRFHPGHTPQFRTLYESLGDASTSSTQLIKSLRELTQIIANH